MELFFWRKAKFACENSLNICYFCSKRIKLFQWGLFSDWTFNKFGFKPVLNYCVGHSHPQKCHIADVHVPL